MDYLLLIKQETIIVAKLLPFYFLILFAYILYLSIKAGYLSKKAKNYLYQKEYKAIARFSFLPFITALIQITVDHLLIFNLGLAYSIFLLFIIIFNKTLFH